MDTLSFLQRVLPSPEGNYCAAMPSPSGDGRFGQRWLRSVADLADYVQLVSQKEHDVYYAIAEFNQPAPRKADNAKQLKTIVYDIDVGKANNSYPDRQQALAALGEFLAAHALPRPVIVSSGAGLHVYWIFTAPVPAAEWLPVAEAMKALALRSGLIIDPAVTADRARILRPVGTLHTKSGRYVKVLLDSPDIEFESLKNNLPIIVPSSTRKTTLLDNLKVAIPESKFTTATVTARCAQVAWAVSHPEEVSEPLWYNLMGLANYAQDRDATIEQWSKGHPTYDFEAAKAKADQWKANASGPPLCKSFDGARPGGCAKCPFAKMESTPASLGRVVQAVELEPEAPAPETVRGITLPRPYKRTAEGIVVSTDGGDFGICPFDIFPVSYGHDERLGYEVAKFSWKRPHDGWSDLTLRHSLLAEGERDFQSTIGDQGIILSGRKRTEMFQTMLRDYLAELKKLQPLSPVHSAMGWRKGYKQFVLGDTVFRREDDGTVTEASATLSANSRGGDMFVTSGTLESWVDYTALFTMAKMPSHMFALGMGWAAPLFEFSGLKGITVSLYGPTGGGKSLAQYWLQSIYGDPSKLHYAAKFTTNALFARLGSYKHLPMTVDEATMIQDKDMGEFLYWVTQGQDKQRLSRSADERSVKTWATPVIVSTNVSLHAKLAQSGLDTTAQAARLLEVHIKPHKLFTQSSEAGRKIYNHIHNNYGHAGRKFIKHLMAMGEDAIRKRIEKAQASFSKKYDVKFSGEERYWELAIILQDLGSEIAQEAKLINYDYRQGTRWALEQLGLARTQLAETRSSCVDMLTKYINDVAKSAVTVTQSGHQPPVVDFSRLPRDTIVARFELHRASPSLPFTRGRLVVSHADLRMWCATRNYDMKQFLAEARSDGFLLEGVSSQDKYVIGKNTPIKTGQVRCVFFDLTHPALKPIMDETEEAVVRSLNAELASLQVIDGGKTDGRP